VTATDGFVFRHGKRIAVQTAEPTPRKPRKPFEAQWVKLPRHWVEALRRTRSVNTYRLAILILMEMFERKYRGGEIVLSAQVTRGMSRASKARAAEELVALGLIETQQEGHQAIRVTNVSILFKEKNRRI
jgi:hypothetical protein